MNRLSTISYIREMEKKVKKTELEGLFKAHFQGEPVCFQAPGRINLIGEHTDYNGGFVMPAGIDLSCCVAIALKDGGVSRLIAHDFSDEFEFSGIPVKQVNGHWANYVFGVMQCFSKRGIDIPSFDLLVKSDIPIGAGLSSSAAFESALAVAFNQLLDCGFSSLELTRIAKEAENKYVGLQCGIMDMFASIHSKRDHCMLLNCDTLAFDYVPLDLEGKLILLIDTCVKHELSSSAYNERRNECEKAVAQFKEMGFSIRHLCDVDQRVLFDNRSYFDQKIFARAKHAITENERVHAFARALTDRNWNDVKTYLLASHESLKTDYEVSCTELDFVVDQMQNLQGVWGCRMMGGGFGGCVISIVDADQVENIKGAISPLYKKAFGITPKQYIAKTGDGACEL